MFSDYKKRPLGLILLLLMILMGFEVGTKKPLCITSKIVNKIDRISRAEDASSKSKNTESIYSCSAYKIPRFSVYFYENLATLNARIHRIEKVAALLGLDGRMDIEINELTSGDLKLKNNKISVSKDRLDDPQLEKLFVTVLLLQNMKFESAPFVGFLAGWLTGHVSSDSAIEEIWYDSFETLSAIEQFNFKEAVYAELRTLPEFSHKTLSENMAALLNAEGRSVQKFKSVFDERLKNLGISGSSPVADIIFENRTNASADAEALAALAKIHKTKRVIYEDAGGSYLLPFMTKIDAAAVSQITGRLRVVLVDSKTKLDFNSFYKNTEKLVVFNAKPVELSLSKKSPSKLKFSSLFASNDLKKNELAFLNANKSFDVIQMHIPSLRYTKAAIGPVADFAGLVSQTNSFAVKKKLGWKSEEWSAEAQAFKPVAVYDVIQYYRIN